ncbi:CHAT domain-containing protein [Neolewinella agarilytica]|uniref:CHAT domain-containing protein n=1 Tax=Neolewinella agarilytica TaxID=478744 RepID=UPI002353BECF|nr:CHAT domain-containing tetratricopeptide repeat protein [Neolewinella agarilytica]
MNYHRCTGSRWGALLFFLIAVSATLLGQSPEQLLEAEEYAAAAEAFWQRGSRTDLLKAGEAWSAVDSFLPARQAYAALMKEDNGTPIIDSLSGLAQHKIGVSHYNEYDDAGAASAYRKAILIRDEVFTQAHKDQAHSRRNLANCLSYLGQTDSASLLLREAIDIYETVQPTDSVNWLRSLQDLSQVSAQVRDYQTGVSASRRAINLLHKTSAADVYDAHYVYYTSGVTFYTFQELEEAATAAKEALKYGEEIGDPLEIGQTLNLLGAINDDLGNDQEKIAYWERAINYLTENEVGKAEIGRLHFNLARAKGGTGEITAAFGHVAEARALLTEDAPDYLPRLFSVEGVVFRETGNHEKALAAFNAGLQLLAPYAADELAYPNPDSLSADELETAADLLGDRARTLVSLGRPEAALTDYTLLFALQDQLRTRVSADESRSYLSQNLRPYFDQAITLLYGLHQKEPAAGHDWSAFELSERAKAYTLLANLKQNQDAMPRQEAELRARIAELERSLDTKATNEELLAAARLQLDRLVQSKRKEIVTPDFGIDRQELHSLLSDTGSDLLAFHLGKKDGYRFYFSTDGQLQFTALQNTAALAPSIRRWRASIQEGAYRRKSLLSAEEQGAFDEVFLREGQFLLRQLLSDESLDLGENLCIIPDGPLALLPFGALPLTEEKPPLNYAGLTYLQSAHRIRYAYSATVLRELSERPAVSYQHNLLGFAPSFGGEASAEAVGRSVSLAARLGERALVGLQPLRFNRAEVEDIADMVPGTRIFVGDKATRSRFLEELGDGQILHLSTHGMVNAADPKLSFVAFTQRGDSLELEELLYYNDLTALPLQTELVVLSACETSLGTYVPGETTLSLATAFTAAGARSTLTTLWQVDDAATRDLMVAFYRELATGKDRSEALSAAQLAQLEGGDFAHPYFWSAMTLYGEAGAIDFAGGGINWYYLAGALVGFLLMGGYVLHYNKQKRGADAGAGKS